MKNAELIKSLKQFNPLAEIRFVTGTNSSLEILSIYGEKPFSNESSGDDFKKLAKKSKILYVDLGNS